MPNLSTLIVPENTATSEQGTKADTAYSWGNHAVAGYLTSVTWNDVGSKPTLGTVAPLNIAVAGDATSDQVVTGGDSRLSDDRNPLAHSHEISGVTGLQAALDGKTTTSYVDTQIASLVDTAPGTLDTLNELAAALGDDPNFATTISTQIGTKLNASAYTANDVLAKLLTVHGTGSGLDADLLDGQEAAAFVQQSEVGASANQVVRLDGSGRLPAVDGSLLTGISVSYTVTQTDVTAHQGALTITKSQVSDFGSYATPAQGAAADDALPRAGGTMTGLLKTKGVSGTPLAFPEITPSSFQADVSEADFFTTNEGGNADFSFTGFPPSGDHAEWFVEYTGSFASAPTFAGVTWPDNTPPDAPMQNEVVFLGFYTRNAGTTIYGFELGRYA